MKQGVMSKLDDERQGDRERWVTQVRRWVNTRTMVELEGVRREVEAEIAWREKRGCTW